MDHLCQDRPVLVRSARDGRDGVPEVLVTEVKEVLRAWLAGLGKRPAAARAGVNVKPTAQYIRAAQEAGLRRDGGKGQLTDELLGVAVAAVRPARPAGCGASWELLEGRKAEVVGWVKQDLMLVRIGELLERSGTVVPYRTLARFAAAEAAATHRGRRRDSPGPASADDLAPGERPPPRGRGLRGRGPAGIRGPAQGDRRGHVA
jgi:hypothetical protein